MNRGLAPRGIASALPAPAPMGSSPALLDCHREWMASTSGWAMTATVAVRRARMLGPAADDRCPAMAACTAELHACRSFSNFLSGSSVATWSRQMREPSRRTFQEVIGRAEARQAHQLGQFRQTDWPARTNSQILSIWEWNQGDDSCGLRQH